MGGLPGHTPQPLPQPQGSVRGTSGSLHCRRTVTPTRPLLHLPPREGLEVLLPGQASGSPGFAQAQHSRGSRQARVAQRLFRVGGTAQFLSGFGGACGLFLCGNVQSSDLRVWKRQMSQLWGGTPRPLSAPRAHGQTLCLKAPLRVEGASVSHRPSCPFVPTPAPARAAMACRQRWSWAKTGGRERMKHSGLGAAFGPKECTPEGQRPAQTPLWPSPSEGDQAAMWISGHRGPCQQVRGTSE